MFNIKQKIFNFTISFLCLLLINSCSHVKEKKNIQNSRLTEIALILPLSNSESELGKEYAKMIKMGLANGAKTKIRITTYDGGSEGALNESIEKILDTGTDIIIGPFYSEPTRILAEKIKNKGITILSLSNNPVLAGAGVYIYGHAPMRQLDQLTNYLLDQKYQNYILLLPKNHHSTTVAKILDDMIIAKNGIVEKIEFYEATPEEIEKSVKTVSDIVDHLNENDFYLHQPVIILGDDPINIPLILDTAKRFNLDRKAILAGDNKLEIGITKPVNVVFTGSMNAMDINLLTKAYKIGIQHVSFMHSLSYDAGNMIGDYIGAHYNKADFLAKMNSSACFVGVSGNIHFVDSIASRKYDILKKQNDQIILLSNVKE